MNSGIRMACKQNTASGRTLRHQPALHWLSALVTAVLLMGCERAVPEASRKPNAVESTKFTGKLLVTGSSTTAPLMSKIAQDFTQLHPDVAIKVEMGGSGRGISDARDGKADIGMVSRVLTEQDKDLTGFPVARDGVGILVNAANPVSTVSQQQAADIFTGKVRNWKDVGGRDRPIIVISRADGRGSTELLKHHFKLKQSDLHAQKTLADNTEAIASVGADADAITLMSIVVTEHLAQNKKAVKMLALDGVTATSRNIVTGNYPLSRPLTLVTKALPSGLTKAFIEFALSSQAVETIRTMGFVPYQE